MHPMTFRNHIRNREKKLNQMRIKSRFQIFFLGMVYTLGMTLVGALTLIGKFPGHELDQFLENLSIFG